MAALRLLVILTLAAGMLAVSVSARADIVKGEYLFHASGGCSCHTKPEDRGGGTANDYLSGGRAIKTPFGDIYSTNITSDSETGIGSWTTDEFINAMTRGVHKDGYLLYPVFPFASFTKMADDDLRDMFEFLKKVPAVSRKNVEQNLIFPMNIRWSLLVWRWLFLDKTKFSPNPDHSAPVNRGDYLVNAVAHCGECHTERNLMGAQKSSLYLAGSRDGPEGEMAPNITPDEATGLGDWDERDISYYLKTGMTPDGDFASGLMAEVIDYGYKHLTDQDLDAMASYLKSIKPINHEVSKDEQKD